MSSESVAKENCDRYRSRCLHLVELRVAGVATPFDERAAWRACVLGSGRKEVTDVVVIGGRRERELATVAQDPADLFREPLAKAGDRNRLLLREDRVWIFVQTLPRK